MFLTNFHNCNLFSTSSLNISSTSFASFSVFILVFTTSSIFQSQSLFSSSFSWDLVWQFSFSLFDLFNYQQFHIYTAYLLHAVLFLIKYYSQFGILQIEEWLLVSDSFYGFHVFWQGLFDYISLVISISIWFIIIVEYVSKINFCRLTRNTLSRTLMERWLDLIGLPRLSHPSMFSSWKHLAFYESNEESQCMKHVEVDWSSI